MLILLTFGAGRRHPVANSVISGILAKATTNSDIVLLTIHVTDTAGRTTAAAVMRSTAGYLSISHGADPASVQAIAQCLYEALPQASGFIAETSIAEAFTARWTELTACTPLLSKRFRVFAANTIDQQYVDLSSLRCCGVEDAEHVLAWAQDFYQAVDMPSAVSLEQVIDDLRAGAFFYWMVKGQPVSLVKYIMTPPKSARVCLVYTPEEHRRHGHGTNAVGSLSHMLLSRDHITTCVIYTDLSNPVTNSIYPKVSQLVKCS